MNGAPVKESDTRGGEGRCMLCDPVDLMADTAILDVAWSKFASQPEFTIPKRQVMFIKNLSVVAANLVKKFTKPCLRSRVLPLSALGGRAFLEIVWLRSVVV